MHTHDIHKALDDACQAARANGPETILTAAQKVIYGDRERTYGSPRKNLDTIAAYWTAHLKARGLLPAGPSLTFEDVAIMMAALKLARLANNPGHKDSQVDGCGYLALLERCQNDTSNLPR